MEAKDSSLVASIKSIAHKAGTAILAHYGQAIPVESKSDNSPLTLADLASHRVIVEKLGELDSGTPILSEESEATPASERSDWRRFWLVDPMDGTKEFIKQSGQFTVNIALIEEGEPVLGVVYAPAIDLWYWATKEGGAFKSEGQAEGVEIKTAEPSASALRIVASRDHAGPMVKDLFERFPGAEGTSMGSSLKFCLVAEGKADIYLRDVPTMEWDTGAAQCIVEAAGGVVRDLEGQRLRYNKAVLRNPSIVTLGRGSFGWQ